MLRGGAQQSAAKLGARADRGRAALSARAAGGGSYAGADRGACRLPLRSAYADVQGAEPCYTSVDPAFPHCIDYVFYNGCGVLRPSRVLGVIDRKQQLPQAPWPSDHLCLVAAFDLTGAGPSPCKFGDQWDRRWCQRPIFAFGIKEEVHSSSARDPRCREPRACRQLQSFHRISKYDGGAARGRAVETGVRAGLTGARARVARVAMQGQGGSLSLSRSLSRARSRR